MENIKYSNILITGGSGFIGSHLTEKLLQYENVTITVVDNHFSCNVLPNEIEAKIRLEKIDIRNLADLERIFKVIRPEICFHLAAIHFIPYCIKHPNEVIDVNIKGTANIQHLCFKYGCNLIQASTADVYKQDENPHKENSLMKTTNIYGYTKKVNEDTLDFFFKERENELFGAKIRIFNAYGSRDTQPHVITEIMNQIKNQKNQDVINLELGNIEPKRDFIYVKEIAECFISIANNCTYDNHTFNLGSGESWSIKEVIEEIERILQKTINITTSEKRYRKSDRMNLQADITKIREQIGWKPKISISEGLQLLLKEELL